MVKLILHRYLVHQDGEEQSTRVERNQENLVINSITPQGLVYDYEYDAEGNLTHKVETATGEVTEYE